MTTHIADELPLLLTGDATREVVLAAAAHLRACADCQQELVSAVVAHASLMSAHRFAPEMLARRAEPNDTAGPVAPAPLPDLSPVFSRARTDAAAPRRSPRTRRTLLAVAAAAVIGVGGGVAIDALTSGGSGTPTRSVGLSAFQKGTEPATITIVGNRTVKLDATKLPKLDSEHVYELWVTDSSRKKMWPVGLIGTDNKAELTMNPKVTARYTSFEVSVQPTDLSSYSGVSVLRGAYN